MKAWGEWLGGAVLTMCILAIFAVGWPVLLPALVIAGLLFPGPVIKGTLVVIGAGIEVAVVLGLLFVGIVYMVVA